ncbi:prefoldin subunit alpha [Candidatus Micrarchaeota archaeon]|nr:prefoldin subunit alpha [Candidatus Micrarchaeota archaeon]
MASAEEMQMQLGYELAVYREQVAMIKRETERVSLTTIDLANALRTVENLSAESALIPIGGGAMVRGTIAQTRILIPIGAEYMLEMEKGDAENELRRRIEATKKAVEKLNEEFNRIASKLREIAGQIQQMQTQTQLSDKVEGNIREDYI